MRWTFNVTCNGKKGNAQRIVMGKPERERTLRRSVLTWQEIIEWMLGM
jgi:hypothetical protein